MVAKPKYSKKDKHFYNSEESSESLFWNRMEELEIFSNYFLTKFSELLGLWKQEEVIELIIALEDLTSQDQLKVYSNPKNSLKLKWLEQTLSRFDFKSNLPKELNSLDGYLQIFTKISDNTGWNRTNHLKEIFLLNPKKLLEAYKGSTDLSTFKVDTKYQTFRAPLYRMLTNKISSLKKKLTTKEELDEIEEEIVRCLTRKK